MEVVAAAPEGAGGAQPSQPFARRDVREWSRLDSVTGAREHARVESDRWSTRSAAGARSYGKVVDSRVCNAADGRAQATSRRQLEVFRQQSPGGSFQVVRTSTTSVSSSSSGGPASARLQLGFENLQLPLNPLDVGPQRTRASVGRSGSIGSRRPPSRQPRAALSAAPAAPAAAGAAARDAAASPVGDDADAEVDSLTAQVSRICRQLHAEAQRAAFGPSASRLLSDAAAPAGDSAAEESDGGVVIQELSDSDSAAALAAPTAAPAAAPAADHPPAVRLRSSSIEDLQDASQATGQPAWTRASQVRRSLQFPTRASQERESSPTQRPLPGRLFPEDSKLFEGGKLKGLEALENVFRRGANIAESVNKSMTHDREDVDASNSDSLANHLRNESMNRSSSHSFNMDSFMRRPSTNGTSSANSTKRHSFVTVESLKEVRGRLRPLNSPSDEEPKQLQQQKSILKPTKDDEDHDDGIVTDDHVKHPEAETTSDVPTSKVKCFILGMEGIANNRNGTRKPVLGTGSLESRTSSRSNSSSNNRSEEWYNRRKSYGFEQVHAQDSNDHVRPTRLWEKNRVESSTDSGICRSSEAVSGPPWNRTSPSKIEEGKAFDNRKTDNVLKISHNIQIKKQEEKDKISEDNENERNAFQRGRRTIVTLGNEYNKNSSTYKPADDGSIVVHNSIIKDTSSISLNGYRGAAEDEHRFKPLAGPGSVKDLRRQSEPVTITIPIVSEDADKETSNVESKRLFFRQLSEGTSLSIESGDRKSVFANGSTLRDSFKRGTWNGGDDWNNASKAMDNEMKRHSIAVDESKYVREGIKRFSNLHDTKSKELANVSTSELVKRFAAMHAGKKEESVFSNKDKFSQNSAPSGFNVSFVQNGESFGIDDQNKKHKKVEFCKTEVHFAAESGRVNIVETDEKPPPSNPIRRRRRVSAGSITQSVTPDPTKSTLPEIRFGDSPYEKQLLGGNETAESTDVAPTPVLVKPEPTRPTVVALAKYQNDGEKEDQIYTQANATIATTIHQESTLQSYEGTTADHLSVSSQFNEPMPRSILKNNRKPKPFILGENNEAVVETSDSQDDKWGVRLRPVQSNTDTGAAMWRSTVTLRSTAFDCSQQSTDRKEEPLPASIHGNGESELQKMIKALRPAGQRRSNSETDSTSSPQCSPVAAKKSIGEPTNNSVQVTISSPPTESVFNGWTVADRIKHVEDLKHSSETKGYSTRINFGSGEATVVESGSSDDQQNASQKHAGGAPLFQKSDKSKPMWLRREEKKQELQDAKNSNKGLVVRIGKSEQLVNGEVHSSLVASPESSGSEPEGRQAKTTTTTTITIDLSPSPSEDISKQVFGEVGKFKSAASEHLQSPSLIMKTIHNPNFSNGPPKEPSPRPLQLEERPKTNRVAPLEAKKPEPPQTAKNMPSQLAALKELYYSGDFSDDSERADEEVRSYMSGEGGGGGGLDSPAAASPEARHADDSGSVVSGSWSRVRAFRHVKQHHRAAGQGAALPPVRPARSRPSVLARAAAAPGAPATPERGPPRKDAEHEEPHHQVSVASAMLPSYDPNRLRRVETLVSTRSGQPKITSIALHYEGDQADDRQPKSSSSFSASTYSQQQQSSAWKNLESSNAYAPRNEEKPSVGFSYYKPTESAKQPLADDRRDRTYKIDKHKERLHIEETVTREKSSPNREPLFSSDRRTSPPKEGHLRSPSPPTSRRPTTFSSPNKTSSPSGRYDSDRERSMSPASKPQPKATTYFGEVRSSAFGSPYRQDSPRKSEGSRSYERKSEERTHRRSTMESTGGGHQRALLDASSNGHQRALVENVNNGHQRSRVGVSTREEHRRYSYESAARSRSASRGRSLSPAKAIDSRKQPPAPPQPPQEETGYDSPIYENIDEVLEESVSTRRAETDSAILEELTRAADQILQAVNGYTDEDSRASSDDDDASKRYRRGRRGGRPAERLCTIAEAPPARRARDAAAASSGAATRASAAAGAGSSAGAAARRAQRPSQTRLGRNSSTSSVESFTREVRRSAAAAAHAQTHARALLRRERQAVEETRRKVTAAQAAAGPGAGASRASSRAARLLQRASSRELLLKAHASSSEDVMSGAEAADAAAALAARKARAPRRARAATAASAAKSSSLTSASSGGRRASPSRPAPPAAPAAAVAAAAGAARPRRREADVPKGKERSHGARPEESRRRSASRRDEAEAARARLSAGGRPAGYGSGAGGLSGGMGGGGRERGSSDRRATAALASSSAAATAARAAAAAAAAAGPPTHAVAKKPSSSRSESLSHSKISK